MNNEKNDNFKNLTDTEEVTEIIEKEAEILPEEDNTTDTWIEENTVMTDVLKAPNKKQLILIVAGCLLALAFLVVCITNLNTDKKDSGDVKLIEKQNTTTTQNLMDEFAEAHGLVVTTINTNTTTATSTTTELRTRPVTSTAKTSQTITTTAAVTTKKTYENLQKIDYSEDYQVLGYTGFSSGDNQEEYEEELSGLIMFDPTLPDAPVYRKQVYQYNEQYADNTGRSFAVGDGILSAERMKEIVDKSVETLGLTVIKIGFQQDGDNAYYDYPLEPNGYYTYAALCRGASVSIRQSGEFTATIRNYELPDGYSYFELSTNSNVTSITNTPVASSEERRKTYQYLLETYRDFLGMKNPAVTAEHSEYFDYHLPNGCCGIYDKDSDEYEFPYVDFTPTSGMLTITRNYEPKAKLIADYPIMSVQEAKEKLLSSEYMKTSYPQYTIDNIVAYGCSYNVGTYSATSFRAPFYVFLFKGEEYEDYGDDTGDYFMNPYRKIVFPAIIDEYTENVRIE